MHSGPLPPGFFRLNALSLFHLDGRWLVSIFIFFHSSVASKMSPKHSWTFAKSYTFFIILFLCLYLSPFPQFHCCCDAFPIIVVAFSQMKCTACILIECLRSMFLLLLQQLLFFGAAKLPFKWCISFCFYGGEHIRVKILRCVSSII